MKRTVFLLFICAAGCQDDVPNSQPTSLTDVESNPLLTTAQSSVGSMKMNSVGMKLVPVPPGEFLMGSPEGEAGRFANEIQHKVNITSAFYMGSTEVTQRQWQSVMGTEPWKGKKPFVRAGPDYPAMFVSWDDAVEFCKELSEQEGLEYRLPTEAEWEYACRAGSSTAYSFGDDAAELVNYAWVMKNSYVAGEAFAHRVGEKLPNAWGLYDMYGNVWEWCGDWHGPYPDVPVTDPRGPSGGSGRVIRGDRWVGKAKTCRSADRIGNTPDTRDVFLGFRVVLTLHGWNPVRAELATAEPAAPLLKKKDEVRTAAAGVRTEQRMRSESQVKALPGTTPVAVSTDGYIGSQDCKACHEHEHAAWHDTYHRTMTQLPSSTSVVGDFGGIELEHHGQKYRVGRDEEKETSWIESESPDGSGAVRRDVVLCTGSHHMQAYWMSTARGSELELFPFVWLIAEEKWIPRRSSFLTPPTHEAMIESGRWNSSCIMCHTTHGNRHVKPSELDQSTVSEFGIACEACHGPGESHVRRHRSPDKSDTDDLIVNPADLSHVRNSEVCGRCHMAWTFEEPDSLLTFRPGDDLQSTRRVEMTETQFWPDGVIRVVGDEFNGLTKSPCFERGTMTCLSCHTMHQARDDSRPRAEWTDDLLKPQMRSNEACLACHEDYRTEASLVAHTHHQASSDGSLCYNCHMPNTAYGLLKLTRCHQISSPLTGEFLNGVGRPNACNLCHLDKSLQWTDQTLAGWYGHDRTQGSGSWPDHSLSIDIALRGDAAQRALIAWHMGWDPARKASKDQWLTPFLAILMQDNYPAVRFIAERSLGYLGGYEDIAYDPEMPADRRETAARAITQRWKKNRAISNRPDLLINPDGSLQRQKIDQLLQMRVHSQIYLDE